jgi:hypothetical protein
LAPGFVSTIVDDSLFAFARRTILLNNINDKEDALRLAKERLAAGEIDQINVVEDHLDEALAVTGLTKERLGKIAHFSNWALAALVIPGNDYMVHWDAEIRMVQPYNWIDAALQLFAADSRVAVANPLWKSGERSPEFREWSGDFALSYGFSDQVYLLNRREFARPIYDHWVPIALRYPVAHISPYFEQMVDSYLRVANRYRATHMVARYEHPVEEGISYPRDVKARALFTARRIAVAAMRRTPGRHRYFHD